MSQSSTALISVIVPVYNAEKYLTECLDSILRQTYQNLEVILVNDGSTDRSLEIIEEYAENDERIVAFSIENSGPGSCRNIGLDHFTGDYVMFVDSDDTLCDDLFELLLNMTKSTSEIVMCKFSKDISNMGQGSREVIGQTSTFTESVKQMYSPGFASAGPYSKLYGRDIFEYLRFPDIAMYEDSAISLQVLSNAEKVIFVDYIGYYYRFNPESITNKTVSERNFSIFKKTDIVLNFVEQEHPEAINLARTICVNDNEYVMMESTRVKTEISKTLFTQLFKQNKELTKEMGLRKLLYLNPVVLYMSFRVMNKVYYNDIVRNFFKKVLGV
ncbi:glycosyltransferase family 2 protein [Lactococcus formosensis]|uniref:glycosyltransferase family 2 protein n=1 Tax=Lactococcus formosensis TaxID=1281486 RepID=UPI001BCA8418|nr:glycosyltransferase family A protein [Lactococcus formosensis]